MGKLYSIFTAELVAILMALNYILSVPINVCKILLCVDSKSVLQAIRSRNLKTRLEMTIEIKHVIHLLSLRGIGVTFCWVPSHCGIYSNEWVDQAARKAARNLEGSFQLNIPLDLHECYRCIQKVSRDHFNDLLKDSNSQYYQRCVKVKNAADPKSFLGNLSFKHSRQITSLVFRFRLNALRTKFVTNIHCMCGKPLSVNHLLVQCQRVKQLVLQKSVEPLSNDIPISIENVLNNFSLLCLLSERLNHSPVGIYL
eukprot:TRINITY_DN4763_c0_g2_i1.p1 TRINITY_DN4763_c0_g2~~TRINITY_DN4763_c0_g2_i1.p1  ORF type:complete len:255 (-),score=-4.74 TRINITY_DN4763_c0_g2_i1:332-1096(-)